MPWGWLEHLVKTSASFIEQLSCPQRTSVYFMQVATQNYVTQFWSFWIKNHFTGCSPWQILTQIIAILTGLVYVFIVHRGGVRRATSYVCLIWTKTGIQLFRLFIIIIMNIDHAWAEYQCSLLVPAYMIVDVHVCSSHISWLSSQTPPKPRPLALP